MTFNNDNRNEHDRRNSFANDPRDPRGGDPRQSSTRNTGGSQGGGESTERRQVRREDLKIPPGQYRIEYAGNHKWAKGTQHEQIAVSVRFVEGPGQGQVRTWYGSFSPAAMDITLRGMRALGWTGGPRGDDITDCSTMVPGKGGKIALATLEHDEYEGSWKEKVAFINEEGAAVKEELNPNELSRFQQRMRSVLGRNAPAASQQGRGQQQPSRGTEYNRQGYFGDQGRRGNGGGDSYPHDDDEPPPPPDDGRGGYGRR